MTIHLANLSGVILAYLLGFSRIGAMVMLLPAIGDAAVPPMIRLVLALAITFAIAPILRHFYPAAPPASVMALALLIIKEVTIGLLIGVMAKIIMSTLQVAGSLIASQIGLSYSETLDPAFGGQDTSIGNFLGLLGTVLIFATNLHHLAISAIIGSYHIMPPGASLPAADMARLAIRLVTGSFALGLQLAAPFIVFGFAVNVGFGFLAKMMPQLQVFFIAMPLNLLAGFFLMILLLGTMMTAFLSFFGTQMAHFMG
ncbi:MAG: flagellar type III secretion system protein FliR [Alphaproteobacteria bacterium]|nr:flagellar type III secretion system protein FliR [Alphaproteobacteria bacterium]